MVRHTSGQGLKIIYVKWGEPCALWLNHDFIQEVCWAWGCIYSWPHKHTQHTHTHIGFPCPSANQLPWLPRVIKGTHPYLFTSFIISKALSVPRHKIIVKWIKCETKRAFHSAGHLAKLSNQANWTCTTSILKKASEALCRENKTC